MTRTRSPRRVNAGNTLIGIFIGLLLGLLIASVIAIYMSKSPFPFTASERQKAQAREKAAAPKADTAKADERRFDFQSVVPGQQDASKGAAKPAPAEPARADAPVNDAAKADTARLDPGKGEARPGESFLLQAGSFQNPADADNQKARLALIGLEAYIEPTPIPDRGTWYRVRLGPFKSLSEVNAARSSLAANGIEVQLLRSKPN